MTALSPPARYSVILIDCTLGSSAACEMNASTLVPKLSYGWCTISARWRMTSKIGRSVSFAAAIRPAVTDGHASSFRSGRSRSSSCHRKLRSSGERWNGHVLHRQIEFAHQQFEHLGADVVGHLEAHRLVEAAAAEFHLDRFEQVVGLFLLEREVGVAADPERRPVLDDHADEQPVELGGDELLDREESSRRRRHEPREQRWAPSVGRSGGRRSRDRRR